MANSIKKPTKIFIEITEDNFKLILHELQNSSPNRLTLHEETVNETYTLEFPSKAISRAVIHDLSRRYAYVQFKLNEFELSRESDWINEDYGSECQKLVEVMFAVV